ncbi:Cytochrome b561 domain-containing protein [Aphelenchoides bicaudatus]|nr:Cytochrome b561 domain-containing protein [Aphelenchoides bicaudatus]
MSILFDKQYQILNEEQSSKLFTWALTASQVLGVCVVMSVVFWMGGYGEGGYSWSSSPEQQFHYHPTLMAMGLIFLQGEALIVYRVFRKEKKRFTKLLHLTLHSLTIIFTIISLRAVFNSHNYHKDPEGNLSPIPNLLSLHSWLGLTVVIVYCLQFLVGFLTFFFPGFSTEIRQFIMPFHKLTGILIFLSVAGVALSGISERAAWKHTCWTVDKEFCSQQAMSNFFGVFIIGYVFTVIFIVSNPRWAREPLHSEELERLT